MSLLGYLFAKSAGVGVGIFIGCLIGLSIRKGKGQSGMLVGGSVLLTAVVAAALATAAMMFFTYLGLPK
ncbi:hypothetical protein [Puniceibacterium sediminis]|uniref:Uncharacterized protein n=1 Tax=Puniceibacterium sediminis TaxID=1608407 RepID=A0A238W4X3_9RHOB|nr:hypothetical protein [Puniceibacterium sediminis]SNR41451.1 hypothetical protein SAMN06265370_104144 [Puniceibacterium sediminis]